MTIFSLSIPSYGAMDPTAAEFFIAVLHSGLVLSMASVFTAIYVNGENKNGFIRNIAGRVHFRGKIFLSKILPILAINTAMFAIHYIFTAIYFAVGKRNLNLLVTNDNAKAIAFQFLLHFAFLCLTAMITTVTRRTVFPALVSVLPVLGDIRISEYTLIANIRADYIPFWIVENPGAVVCVAVGYIVVSIAIGVLFMNKSDVK